jgi:hypothetical protein
LPVLLPHYINAHFMQRSCVLAHLNKGDDSPARLFPEFCLLNKSASRQAS